MDFVFEWGVFIYVFFVKQVNDVKQSKSYFTKYCHAEFMSDLVSKCYDIHETCGVCAGLVRQMLSESKVCVYVCVCV